MREGARWQSGTLIRRRTENRGEEAVNGQFTYTTRSDEPQRPGATLHISYDGLKGGRDSVETIIEFELKRHHLWVDANNHRRGIMLWKRYNEPAVAPIGLKGKL
jgi:hypothetical protein